MSPFELMATTKILLAEVSNKTMTRDDVAITYALALHSSTRTDWQVVNAAILDRWSLSALEYIKTKAWELVQTGDNQ